MLKVFHTLGLGFMGTYGAFLASRTLPPIILSGFLATAVSAEAVWSSSLRTSTNASAAIAALDKSQDKLAAGLLPSYIFLYSACNIFHRMKAFDYRVCQNEEEYYQRAKEICVSRGNDECLLYLSFIRGYSLSSWQGKCAAAEPPLRRAFSIALKDHINMPLLETPFKFFFGGRITLRSSFGDALTDRISAALKGVLSCLGNRLELIELERQRSTSNKRWSVDYVSIATFREALKHGRLSEARIALDNLGSNYRLPLMAELEALTGDFASASKVMFAGYTQAMKRDIATVDAIVSSRYGEFGNLMTHSSFLQQSGDAVSASKLRSYLCSSLQAASSKSPNNPRFGSTGLQACALMAIYGDPLANQALCKKIRKLFASKADLAPRNSFSHAYGMLGLAAVGDCGRSDSAASTNSQSELIAAAEQSWSAGKNGLRRIGGTHFYEAALKVKVRVAMLRGRTVDAEMALLKFLSRWSSNVGGNALNKLLEAVRIISEHTSAHRIGLSSETVRFLDRLVTDVEEDVASGAYTTSNLQPINGSRLFRLLKHLSTEGAAAEINREAIDNIAFRFIQLRDSLRSGSSYDVLRALNRGGTALEQIAAKRISEIRTQLQALEAQVRFSEGGDGGFDRNAIADKRIELTSALRQVVSSSFPDASRFRLLLSPALHPALYWRNKIGSRKSIIISHCGSLDDTLFVFKLSDKGIAWKNSDVSCAEVDDLVGRLRAGMVFANGLQLDMDSLKRLSRAVLSSLPMTETDEGLVFIFDGALSSFPPQMLLFDPSSKGAAGTPWLIKKYAVSVSPSLESLTGVGRLKRDTERKVEFVSFANPSFVRTKTRPNSSPARSAIKDLSRLADWGILPGDLEGLPDTALEAERLAKIMGGGKSVLYLGKEANERNAKSDIVGRARILHFATHALLAEEARLLMKSNAEPAIVLTIPDVVSLADDGLLTAPEISNLTLSAELVILSACNTAGSGRQGGGGLTGLARAVMHAGADRMIVSHWPVESASTTDLISAFFKFHFEDKLSAAQSLKSAMISIMSDVKNPERQHPAFWAPFILVEPVH